MGRVDERRPRWPRAWRSTVETMPPAGARDLLVAGPLEAHLELARPVAAMHEMGVTVDESRRDEAAFAGRRDPPVGARSLRMRARSTAMRPSFKQHRAIVDQPVFGIAGRDHGRDPSAGQEKVRHRQRSRRRAHSRLRRGPVGFIHA